MAGNAGFFKDGKNLSAKIDIGDSQSHSGLADE
jgi:hypothetical protein